jgi:hypothetical protein
VEHPDEDERSDEVGQDQERDGSVLAHQRELRVERPAQQQPVDDEVVQNGEDADEKRGQEESWERHINLQFRGSARHSHA